MIADEGRSVGGGLVGRYGRLVARGQDTDRPEAGANTFRPLQSPVRPAEVAARLLEAAVAAAPEA